MPQLVPVVLMYEDFFGLRARPFGITPSVELFFPSSAHRRTLAYLLGQLLAGERLIVLTGSIGAGKTTVLQALLSDLPNKFVAATVVSTQLDDVELTRSVLLAFGAEATGRSLDELRAALRSHLEDLRSRGRRGVLVVDEAQNFSAGTLRYLMQLPQLGGSVDEPSLQVTLSGQPELDSLLVVGDRRRGVSTAPLPTRVDEHDGHRILCAASAARRRYHEWAELSPKTPSMRFGWRPVAFRDSSIDSASAC